EEVFNPQVLLNPLEEQLHAPAQLVECRDSQGGQVEVIGQKDQHLAVLGVSITDAAQPVGVMSDAFWGGQPDDVIATQASGSIHGPRLQAIELDAGLGARDKERRSEREAVEPLEIDVATIHDIEGSGL